MKQADLFPLIGSLYDGILSPGGWNKALADLAELTSSQAASLVLWSRTTDRALVGEQVGLAPELVSDYAAHFHQLDPARAYVDRIGVGRWYLDEAHLGDSMRRLSFYQDFLKPFGLDSTMASPIVRVDGLDGFLSLSSAPGRRDLGATAKALVPVMPHFERAALLRVKLGELSQHAELQQHALDRFNFPVLALTAGKRIVMANRAAQDWLLAPRNPLSRNSGDGAALTGILQAACGIGTLRRAAGMKATRADGGAYYLTAIPLPSSNRAGWSEAEPLALLLVNDAAARKLPARELLRQVFGLTPAELRLAMALQRGLTLAEAADTAEPHPISLETARTQLRSVFRKVGVQRQAELLRTLASFEILGTEA
jgi:DNA-binding CsgD family transcriptional regulator